MAKSNTSQHHVKGKTHVNMKLLLKGASRIEQFTADVQKENKKQKYISRLESYLETAGNIHQDVSSASCFKLDISSLEALNTKFNNMQLDLDKLKEAMRKIAKHYIESEYDLISDADVEKKVKAIIALSGAYVTGKEINNFFDHMSDKEKKALAAFLQTETGAAICVSSGLISRLFTDEKGKATKKGKEFAKKYLKAKAKTSNKTLSKTKTENYAPLKYKNAYKTTKAARAAWKKDIVKELKRKYNLTDAEASKLADRKMKIAAESTIKKAKIKIKYDGKTEKTKLAAVEKDYKNKMAAVEKDAQKMDNAHDKAIDNASTDDSKVNTSSNDVIEKANKPTEDAIEPATPSKPSEPEQKMPQEPTTPEPQQPSSPESQQPSEPVTDSSGNTTVEQVQEGPVSNQGEQLPAENPHQDSNNFQEAVNEQRESAGTNPVDETADVTPNDPVGIDETGDVSSDVSDVDTTDVDSSTGTHTTIKPETDTDTSGGTVSSHKSSGSSPVVPVVAGVAAAGAAGVGAKIMLDHRTNSVNDSNFGSENWSDATDEDYGLTGDTDSEYYQSNGYESKNNDLIEDDNTTTEQYDYKANSIDEMNIEEKEKADKEAEGISFHDNIAYDAINEAELSEAN